MALARWFEVVAPNGSIYQIWAESEEEAHQLFSTMAGAITTTPNILQDSVGSNLPHYSEH